PCQTRIRTSQPVFKWKIDDPSTELKLTVICGLNTVWQTTVSNTMSTTYPTDAPALTPGLSYSWTLESTDPLVSPPLRTQGSFFEIITPPSPATLDSDLSHPDASQADSVTYHLARASIYYDHGLIEDAITETESALAADPGNESLRAILAQLHVSTGHANVQK